MLELTVFALFVFAYSGLAGGISRTPISGAIVFTLFGYIASTHVLGILDLDVTNEGLRLLAELTLAVVLFADAAKANLRVLRSSIEIPQRLLLIGLPLTILLGALAGSVIFASLSWLELAVLATALAPTDAVLAAAVVADRRVPARIRQGINVESGLNDGICVPVLFVFLALATNIGTENGTTYLAASVVAEEIGIGVAVGIGLSLAGVQFVRFCLAHNWITTTWRQLPMISLALACFALAEHLSGSGFIAAFIGGLLFGASSRRYKHEALLAAEGAGETLALITWVVFGVGVVGYFLPLVTWPVVIYSLLSLTVIRMLPVFIALTRSGLNTREKLFVSWFGPRGLASIVFGVIVVNAELPGEDVIVETIVCTVLLSVLAHGLSANPIVARMAGSLKGS